MQANKPRDPSLIPTVLALTPPDGVTVDDISYPAPSELAQKDRKETLAVLGPEFTIEIKATLAAGVAAGELKIPGVLRYQACNDSVCFAPLAPMPVDRSDSVARTASPCGSVRTAPPSSAPSRVTRRAPARRAGRGPRHALFACWGAVAPRSRPPASRFALNDRTSLSF